MARSDQSVKALASALTPWPRSLAVAWCNGRPAVEVCGHAVSLGQGSSQACSRQWMDFNHDLVPMKDGLHCPALPLAESARPGLAVQAHLESGVQCGKISFTGGSGVTPGLALPQAGP